MYGFRNRCGEFYLHVPSEPVTLLLLPFASQAWSSESRRWSWVGYLLFGDDYYINLIDNNKTSFLSQTMQACTNTGVHRIHAHSYGWMQGFDRRPCLERKYKFSLCPNECSESDEDDSFDASIITCKDANCCATNSFKVAVECRSYPKLHKLHNLASPFLLCFDAQQNNVSLQYICASDFAIHYHPSNYWITNEIWPWMHFRDFPSGWRCVLLCQGMWKM